MDIQPSLNGLIDFYPAATSMGALHDALILQLSGVRDSVGTRDWKAAKIAGLSCLGLGMSSNMILSMTAKGNRAQAAVQLELASRVSAFLDDVISANDSHLDEAMAIIVDQHTVVSPDTLPEFQSLIDSIVAGTITGAELTQAIAGQGEPLGFPQSFKLAVEASTAARVRGLLTIYHAEFNIALDALSTEASNAENTADLVGSLLTSAFSAFRSSLNTMLQTIQSDLANAQPGVAPESLQVLACFVESELPMMARHAAVARMAYNALRSAGAGQRAEKLGRRAAEAGRMVREAVASYGSSSLLSIWMRAPSIPDEIRELLSDAGDLAFDSAIPNGKDIELSQLSNSLPGTLVEVSGFVESISAMREPSGKLISRATLVDPSSGAKGDIVAVFVHMAHSGITKGSYVRASGVFDFTPPGGGAPALHIDSIPIAKIAEKSFRMRFYRLCRPYFQVWPNRANLFWSPGPHNLVDDIDGINESSSSFGAGELLFQPFIR